MLQKSIVKASQDSWARDLQLMVTMCPVSLPLKLGSSVEGGVN